jgi:hypothetical protein
MSVKAKEIVEQARDYSPLFTRQAIPDIAALKTLSRLQRNLVSLVPPEAADPLAEWVEVSLPEDWEEAGVPLPSHTYFLGAEVDYDTELRHQRTTLNLLYPSQVHALPHLYPSASVVGGIVYLTDVRRWFGDLTGWEQATVLRMRVVPEIEELRSLSQSLRLPGSAESPLTAQLALWMADRVGAKLPTLRERAEALEGQWLNSILEKGLPRSWMITVVE